MSLVFHFELIFETLAHAVIGVKDSPHIGGSIDYGFTNAPSGQEIPACLTILLRHLLFHEALISVVFGMPAPLRNKEVAHKLPNPFEKTFDTHISGILYFLFVLILTPVLCPQCQQLFKHRHPIRLQFTGVEQLLLMLPPIPQAPFGIHKFGRAAMALLHKINHRPPPSQPAFVLGHNSTVLHPPHHRLKRLGVHATCLTAPVGGKTLNGLC